MKLITRIKLTVGLLGLSAAVASARDAARDLRRMVGYTIVAAETVEAISERDGEKTIKLSGGFRFKVDSLLLDPLDLTDVIVFAKAPSKEIREKYQGRLPERLLYSYRLLIDNEAYDATPQ